VVSLPAAYTVSFDLYPTADGTGWRSIIYLTATGKEEDGGAGLAAPDLGGFMSDLGHADSVLIGIEVIEGGGVGIELIAEDDDEVAHEEVRES
jgi:hypothetical protein